MYEDHLTDAADTGYFLFGDGHVSVAIQRSDNRMLSPYAMTLWNPADFVRKEHTWLYHPDSGLNRTLPLIRVGSRTYRPLNGAVDVNWSSPDPDSPEVTAIWQSGDFTVEETFGLDPRSPGTVVRTISVRGLRSSGSLAVQLYANPAHFGRFKAVRNRLIATGRYTLSLEGPEEAVAFERFLLLDLDSTERNVFRFTYRIDRAGNAQGNGAADGHGGSSEPVVLKGTEHFVNRDRQLPDPARVARQFAVSRTSLRGAVAADGSFDASIWQYNYEWGQDAASIVSAALYAGEARLAHRVLRYALLNLCSDEGCVQESSRFRPGELSELNANGQMMIALSDYLAFTGDEKLLSDQWDRIRAVADYPLREEFSHDSGLLLARRDLWERLPWTGVESGFDIAHQTLCAVGYGRLAHVAERLGHPESARKWKAASERIRTALLEDDRYSMIERGAFVHRRLPDGSVQHAMTPTTSYAVHEYWPYLPSSIEGPRLPLPADPDSTIVLPLLYDLFPGDPQTAERTLKRLDKLWNPTDIGGYARSPLAADPDSPGPWPFVTAMIAEAEIRHGSLRKAARATDWLLDTAAEPGSWFEYYGRRNTPPLPPVGLIVWGWAQYLLLVTRGWLGIEVASDRVSVNPSLSGMSYRLPIGDFSLTMNVEGLNEATSSSSDASIEGTRVTIPLPLQENVEVDFT